MESVMMTPMPERIDITRRLERFAADGRRVITRLFVPGGQARVESVLARVRALSAEEVSQVLAHVKQSFANRHKRIEDIWQDNFNEATAGLDTPLGLSADQQLLIGAYFTMEYSIESAALFNPSIVPHYDQRGVSPDAVRFLMSLRATGEGHVSSIVFRTGVIDLAGDICFDTPSPFARSLKPLEDTPYDKQIFFYKLIEIGGYNDKAGDVLDRLPEQFTLAELEQTVDEVRQAQLEPLLFTETAENIIGLARSNYTLELPVGSDPSEAVIFPFTERESKGIEDMRLVRFQDDDGSLWYYGTYTAFNGYCVFPQLLETPNFDTISIVTLSGRFAQNKGHALFPRMIDGWYVMCSRIDGENMYILKSKNVRFWNDAEMLNVPRCPWEFIQVGNCGSPLETDRGWLLLTHGVGPMRQYCIGATLLDLNDPTRVVGHLKDPLLMPNEEERNGYVPNVVYSCGAIIHGDELIIPYAMADSATSVASVPLEKLLDQLCRS